MPKSTRDPKIDEDRVIIFIDNHPLTMKDLGDLVDEDFRTAFQKIIDRGLVPGLAPGSPWYDHIRLDGLDDLNIHRDDNELIDSLIQAKRKAEEQFLKTYSAEDRQAVSEAHQQIVMARKLIKE